MAHTPFNVNVLTPEGEAFTGQVELLATRTDAGAIGIAARHEPLLAMLEPAELRLHRSETDVERWAQGEGYLQVAQDGSVLVLVDEMQKAESLDAAALRTQLAEAEGRLAGAGVGSEAYASAQRQTRRLQAYLRIAEG